MLGRASNASTRPVVAPAASDIEVGSAVVKTNTSPCTLWSESTAHMCDQLHQLPALAGSASSIANADEAVATNDNPKPVIRTQRAARSPRPPLEVEGLPRQSVKPDTPLFRFLGPVASCCSYHPMTHPSCQRG